MARPARSDHSLANGQAAHAVSRTAPRRTTKVLNRRVVSPASAPSTSPATVAAVIDIGSNSIRLAVGALTRGDEVRLLAEARQSTRLAAGMDVTGRMDPHAMEASIDAVVRMVAQARAMGASSVRIVATCAVREAENAARFVAAVNAETGIDMEVISGQQEGELAFAGAARQFDLSKGWSAVLDIGGGSTELVIAHKGKPQHVASLPVGAVRLSERFGGLDRIPADHHKQMRQFIDGLLNKHLKHTHGQADMLVATGGTASAVALVDLLSRHPGRVDPEDKVAVSRAVRGYRLSRKDVKEWTIRFREMSPKERTGVPGLSKDRAQVIVAGLIILHRTLKRLACKRAVVSAGSIRDGVLHQMLLPPHPGSTKP